MSTIKSFGASPGREAATAAQIGGHLCAFQAHAGIDAGTSAAAVDACSAALAPGIELDTSGQLAAVLTQVRAVIEAYPI